MAIEPRNTSTTNLAPEPTAGQAPAAPDSAQLPSADRATVQLTLGHAVLIALVVGIFAVVWLAAITQLSTLIWKNSFVAANRWAIPVAAVFFALLVGLAQKYLHAPTVINGGALEALAAGDYSGYRTFWGALCSSFVSLCSGASVGPEGPLSILATDIAAWLAIRLRLAPDDMLLASWAGMSVAYNGIVGSPIFSAVYTGEHPAGNVHRRLLAVNLVAGLLGFLLFALLQVPTFAGFLDLAEPDVLTWAAIAWAVALGVLGTVIAAYIGIAFRALGKLMSAFADRVIARALVAGVVIGSVGYCIPDLLFSGIEPIHQMIASRAQVGLVMLLLMALLKPPLLALAFKSGYLGGPILPALFTAVMVGLAISLLAPQAPLSILIACLAVAVISLLLGAPLTSIVLMAVVVRAGPYLLGLITLSAVTATLGARAFQAMMSRRRAHETLV